MIFASVSTLSAAGGILAHSQNVAGRRWAKGRVLLPADVAAAAAAGIAALTIARLGADDIAENAAAAQLAATLAGPAVTALAATHGRVNLAATAAGVCRIDTAMVAEVNSVTEDLTLATLADASRVLAGEVIATIKIIPYAVSADLLAATIAKATPIAVAPFRPLAITLIQTHLADTAPKLLAKTARVTRARVEALGAHFTETAPCGHDPAALAAAILAAPGELLLIAGAAATVDRGDVVPAAIIAAGGHIERLGMPVDPGNLLCLGAVGKRAVIGLPGCARSPKRNGFDLVLEMLVAGLPVTSSTIAAMGAGGLLAETERPQPRGQAPAPPAVTGAIILAAGRSSRMGDAHKLLAEWDDTPLIAHVVDAVAAAGLPPPIVVLGARAEAVRAALAGRAATFVVAADYADGLAHSIAAGLAAVPASWDAALVCLGDMPRVAPVVLRALVAAPGNVAVPVHGGKRGNPVRWGRSHFAALAALSGDVGGKALLAGLAVPPTEVSVADDGIFDDIDTPEALAALRARRSVPPI